MLEKMIEDRRLTTAKKAGEQGDGNPVVGCDADRR